MQHEYALPRPTMRILYVLYSGISSGTLDVKCDAKRGGLACPQDIPVLGDFLP